jgi:hypothetical protein
MQEARHAVPRNAGQAPPQILASESAFYPDSEDVMGWDISERGFKIVLSPRLGEFIRARLGRDIDEFLGRHGLRRGEIGSWVIHTGGPKVLEDSLEKRFHEKPKVWQFESQAPGQTQCSWLGPGTGCFWGKVDNKM